jgi:hypothetical protein
MGFDKLKTEHYVMIAIAAFVVVLLFTYGTKEGYTSIQGFPFIPSNYWDPVKLTYWSPWFYNENAYDTVVPKVSIYDPSKCQDIKRLQKKEGFGDVSSLNLTTIVVILLLAAIMYHLFTHEQK